MTCQNDKAFLRPTSSKPHVAYSIRNCLILPFASNLSGLGWIYRPDKHSNDGNKIVSDQLNIADAEKAKWVLRSITTQFRAQLNNGNLDGSVEVGVRAEDCFALREALHRDGAQGWRTNLPIERLFTELQAQSARIDGRSRFTLIEIDLEKLRDARDVLLGQWVPRPLAPLGSIENSSTLPARHIPKSSRPAYLRLVT